MISNNWVGHAKPTMMNNLKIGCTGSDYSIRVIPIDEYIKLTKDLCYENKLFLLPMVEVKEYEKAIV